MFTDNKLEQFDFFHEIKSCLERSSKKILEIYNQENLEVSYKLDETPVTKADLASHHIICECLNSITSYPIVSEESDSFYTKQQKYWLIDPLDGTKEFLNKNGEFTINIALIDNKYPVVGYVYLPIKNILYVGGMGRGAMKCVGSNTEEIFTTNYHDPIRIAASRNNLNKETKDFISQFQNYKLIQAGSSIKFCMVAEGLVDIYPRLSPTSEWDTAAAQAVVEGAGGSVQDLENMRLTYQKKDILNPYFIVKARVNYF